MKKELMKDLCRTVCMLGLILVHFNLSAQIEKVKTIDESFAVQKGALVQISHQKGTMHVKKSMTNTAMISVIKRCELSLVCCKKLPVGQNLFAMVARNSVCYLRVNPSRR